MKATSTMFISDARNSAASSVTLQNTTKEDCLNNNNSSDSNDGAMTPIRPLKENTTGATTIPNTTKGDCLNNSNNDNRNDDGAMISMRPSKENTTDTSIVSTSSRAKVSPSPSPLPSLSPSPLVLSSCGYHDHYHDTSVTDESHMRIKNNIDRRRKKINGWQRSGCGGSIETFPFKLHEMLKKHEFEDMVAWQPHGRCFMIRKVEQFVEDVLPRFFNQSKFRSFQRQLNMYGFRRLRRGVDRGGYYHELFLKGREDLCRRLIRSRAGGKKGPNGTSTLLSTSSSVTYSSSHGTGSDDNNNHSPKESSSLLCATSIAKATVMEPNFYGMEFCCSSSSTDGRKTNNVPNFHALTMMREQQWQQQQPQYHHQQQQQGQQRQQRQQQQQRLQKAFSIATNNSIAEEDSTLRSTNSMDNNIVRSNNTCVPLITPKRKRSSYSISQSYNDRKKNSHFEGEELYFRALCSNFYDVDSTTPKLVTSLIHKERTQPLSPQQPEIEIAATTTLIESEEKERAPSLSASLSLLVLPQIESCLTLPTTEDNSSECYDYSSSKLNTSFAKDENNEIAFLADEPPLTDSIFDEEEIMLPTMNVIPSHSSSPPPSWEDSDIMLALPYPFNEIYDTSEVLLLPST